MAWPQKLEADTRCHAKLPTDQELLYHGCGSTVRVSIEEAGARSRKFHNSEYLARTTPPRPMRRPQTLKDPRGHGLTFLHAFLTRTTVPRNSDTRVRHHNID